MSVFFFKAAMNQQMARLEKAMKDNGGEKWRAVIVAYHPNIKEAWIVVEGKKANLKKAVTVLAKAVEQSS